MSRPGRGLPLLLAGLASVATGCWDESPGVIEVSWLLALESGGTTSCERVRAARVRLTVAHPQVPRDDRAEASCLAGRWELSPARDGEHVVHAELVNDDGAVLARTQPTTLQVKPGQDQKLQLRFVVRAQAIVLDWTLTSGTGVRSCEQAGTRWVELRLLPATGGVEHRERFPCAHGSGTSAMLPPGSYEPSVALIAGEDIAVSGAKLGVIAVDANRPVDLGAVLFRIATMRFGWQITRAGAIANCADFGATTVEIWAHRTGEAGVTSSFPCDQGQTESAAFPVGQYLLEARLLSADGHPLANAQATSELRTDGSPGVNFAFTLP